GVPKMPKEKPLANEPLRKRPEARREEVRAMKRMFDEGYAAVRDSGPRTRPRFVVLNFIFLVLSVVKMLSNLGLLISRIIFLENFGKLDETNSASDFAYRAIYNGAALTIFFQIWLVAADAILIFRMFKQDSKDIIWVYGLSSSLTFFVLILCCFNLMIGYRSLPVASSMVGSYLAASNGSVSAARDLSGEFDCCGFNSPLDWHKQDVFQWDSVLTDTTMTLQQNFSWVDECSEKKNKDPSDNVIPSPNSDKESPPNVSLYPRNDLRLLIHEEGRIRSYFFPEDQLKKLNSSSEGCITAVDRFLQSQNALLLATTVLMALALPLQTFLIVIVFLNDNAIGEFVKIDGEPTMEKLEKCGPLAFFKRLDGSMGVKQRKK
ncbi:hypothetical protein PMAYCL1PPCAC_02969, partial [Pristionchus mayeri]